MSKNAEVELKLPVIPDIELSATKTAEVISKHMSLSEEKTGEISMAIIAVSYTHLTLPTKA